MKVTYISTYPPRECGLASFNKNLMSAIKSNFDEEDTGEQGSVIAINSDNLGEYNYPPEVEFVIRQNEPDDYRTAAGLINESDTDICILQHEFGIFGGEAGIYILSLVNQLKKPLITIFHTVLERPSGQQKVAIQNIAKKSDRVIVMGTYAIQMLQQIYNIPKEKISYVEHGAPDMEISADNPLKAEKLFNDHKVLLTFGLISRNKGLETVIRALPEIIERHKDVVYVILGSTHPGILKSSGEEYRDYLIQLAEELNVTDHVVFINRYVSEEELMKYLSATDIYVSPYLNEAQITSGTLCYAVRAGAAVVATPYWHAKELLSNGRGRLFNFKDEKGLASAIIELLDKPVLWHGIKERAYEYGTHLKWTIIGNNYIDIIEDVIENQDVNERILRQIIDPEIMPEFSLDYVKLLTDSTGIIQHAKYGIPNWKEGYCVDDNARALLMSLMACNLNYSEADKLIPSYLSFLLYMQNEDGYFRNFLSYDKHFLDEKGSEDAFGRAIWALGYLVHTAPHDSYGKLGEELFRRAEPHFRDLHYLRGVANVIIGISYYLRRHPSEKHLLDLLNELTGKLTNAFHKTRGEEWHWFEDFLTYDNAILPLSLLHSAVITGNQEVLSIAFGSLKFLEQHTFKSTYWNPIGNEEWYFRDASMSFYDQQAIETMAMVLMYGQAYEITEDSQYLEKMFSVYQWFLGENSLSIPLYDSETKGCSDGLQRMGINKNQGAESVLAYLISHLTVLQNFKAKKSGTNGEFTSNDSLLFK
jgi:glycosyltransferase involved in cell wall biosynthesis